MISTRCELWSNGVDPCSWNMLRNSIFQDVQQMCRKLHMSDMISGWRPDDATEAWAAAPAFMQQRRIILMQRIPVVIFSLSRELNFNQWSVWLTSNDYVRIKPHLLGWRVPSEGDIHVWILHNAISKSSHLRCFSTGPAQLSLDRERVFPTRLSRVPLWVFLMI